MDINVIINTVATLTNVDFVTCFYSSKAMILVDYDLCHEIDPNYVKEMFGMRIVVLF